MTKQLQRLVKLRNRYMFAIDIALLLLTPMLALFLRTENLSEFGIYFVSLTVFTVVTIVCKLTIFFRVGLYAQYWRYASVEEAYTLIRAMTFALLAEAALFYGVFVPFDVLSVGFPRSLPVIDGLLTIVFISGIRLSVRLVWALNKKQETDVDLKPALVVGAGVAGAMIVKELQTNNQLGLEPVGYIDDDPEKVGKRIHGVQVLGSLQDLPKLLTRDKIAEVIIAMPTAPGKVIRDVVQACKASGVISKTIPGLFEILRGTARVEQFRDIQLEDLLRRGPVKTDTKRVVALLHGTRVMVTGAGGSIGSELCRQIKDFGPDELVLVGHGENSIFQIAQEIREQPKQGLAIRTVIADIRDRERMQQVFEKYRPQVVFHAAAHKHVALMEENAADAVTNNVLGTRNVVELSEQHRVERFVMVSSDKAVNPTSVMGVTKRIAELIVLDSAARTNRPFVAVRFGNVLGSRGSVVPILKRQIELGGPVTITHPEVKRYFMTIPEAVQLVLQAATMGAGGEVFVLDMGEQIKVLDLARDLIRLSGLEEGRDIDITFTGLRPGEKLYEELFFEGDKIERTHHEKILVCRTHSRNKSEQPLVQDNIHKITVNRTVYDEPLHLNIGTLIEGAQQGSLHILERLMKKLVPQYQVGDDNGNEIGGSSAILEKNFETTKIPTVFQLSIPFESNQRRNKPI